MPDDFLLGSYYFHVVVDNNEANVQPIDFIATAAWSDADDDQLSIKPWQSEHTHPVYFNSKDYEINFNGIEIPSGKLILNENSVFSLEDYNLDKGGMGLEVFTTQFDDYVDFSGYSLDDFEVPSSKIADITISPGNDIYIGPSFQIDGRYPSVLDSKQYFKEGHFGNFYDQSVDQGLNFKFLGTERCQLLTQSMVIHPAPCTLIKLRRPIMGMTQL